MVELRLRPRFETVVPSAPAAVRARLRDALAEAGGRFEGAVFNAHVTLTVGAARRHTWSPHLAVDLEAVDLASDAGTRLSCLFGPHPTIWTTFVAGYAILGFSTVIAAVFGLSQWMLGMAPLAWIVVPVAAVLAASLHAVALHGQRLARAQMDELRGLVETAVAVPVAAGAAV